MNTYAMDQDVLSVQFALTYAEPLVEDRRSKCLSLYETQKLLRLHFSSRYFSWYAKHYLLSRSPVLRLYR